MRQSSAAKMAEDGGGGVERISSGQAAAEGDAAW